MGEQNLGGTAEKAAYRIGKDSTFKIGLTGPAFPAMLPRGVGGPEG
jgi:hypothetical protein